MNKTTKVKKYKIFFENHPIWSKIIIVSIIIISIGLVFATIDNIISISKKYLCKSIATNKQHLIDHKEFVNITPADIIKSLEKEDTELKKNNLFKGLYLNKHVEWTGKISWIEALPENKAIFYLNTNKNLFYAIFDNSEVVTSLNYNMIITVFGKIYDYLPGRIIVLEDCVLKDIK